MGPFILRIATKPGAPDLRTEDLEMAIEEINGPDAAGHSLALNAAPHVCQPAVGHRQLSAG